MLLNDVVVGCKVDARVYGSNSRLICGGTVIVLGYRYWFGVYNVVMTGWNNLGGGGGRKEGYVC